MEYLDLLAKTQVYFEALSFLEPDQNWGWEHPVLVQWMEQRGLSRRSLQVEHLRVIVRSLDQAYWAHITCSVAS